MKNNFNEEFLKKKISYFNANIRIIESIAKNIDSEFNNKLTYKQNDISNLVGILIYLINDYKQKLYNINDTFKM